MAGGGLLFFWGPPMGFGGRLWLCVTYCLLNIVSNAVAVATNASFTELYPTALRGTTMGWFALIGAGSSLTAESTISALAKPMGGLSRVVGWLGLLAIPGAILFGLTIDETRGLSLEDAARERSITMIARRRTWHGGHGEGSGRATPGVLNLPFFPRSLVDPLFSHGRRSHYFLHDQVVMHSFDPVHLACHEPRLGYF